MTENELKDVLVSFKEERQASAWEIDSYMRYRDKLVSYHSDVTKPYIDDVDAHIKKVRDRVQHDATLLESWSQLINDETYRAIFIDRYINDLTWQEIEDRHNYSHSQIFNINTKCCKEISRKIIRDLVPDCNINAVTI